MVVIGLNGSKVTAYNSCVPLVASGIAERSQGYS